MNPSVKAIAQYFDIKIFYSIISYDIQSIFFNSNQIEIEIQVQGFL